MENGTTIGQLVLLGEKRLAEKRAKVAEIKDRVTDFCLREGFELEAQDIEDVATITFRREALVRLMAKATPFSERWNEVSKEICDCEAEIAKIDSRLI